MILATSTCTDADTGNVIFPASAFPVTELIAVPSLSPRVLRVLHSSESPEVVVSAFSEALGKVAPALKVDSTFAVTGEEGVTFSRQGLYLVQIDTTSAEGYAFRVQNDYPRLTKLESLADPFIYVCTSQEV